MAIIYPSKLDQSVEMSERNVYESLGRLSNEWHAIHGRRFVIPSYSGRRAIEGELDFLIVHPQEGVLGLEVKGGAEVGRDEQGWYSVPLNQPQQKHRIKDPGAQAQKAVHQLIRYVKDRTSSPELKQISFCHGVAFPGVDIEEGMELGPALPRDMILDRAGLKEPEESLLKMYRAGVGGNGTPLSHDGLRELIGLLIPQFSLVRSSRLKDEIGTQEEMILRLTDEQKRIVEASVGIRRMGIEGRAGTGKTIVAMEHARRLAERGEKVLFLCFNRALADHLKPTADKHRFEVESFHRFCHRMVTDAGLPFKVPQRNPQDFWENESAEKLLSALEGNPEWRWDAVIVDEGQDFKALWWIAVEKLLKSPEDGTLWVFHDPSQNVYGGDSFEELKLNPVKLRLNCRNTRRIARRSYGFLDLKPNLAEHAPKGAQPEEVSCENDYQMLEGVRKNLHHFIYEEKISAKHVVVLSPRSEKRSMVFKRKTFGNFKLVSQGEDLGKNEVSFSTIRNFKGLEADVVILCEVENDSEVCSPKDLYIGTSRAKHALIILERPST